MSAILHPQKLHVLRNRRQASLAMSPCASRTPLSYSTWFIGDSPKRQRQASLDWGKPSARRTRVTDSGICGNCPWRFPADAGDSCPTNVNEMKPPAARIYVGVNDAKVKRAGGFAAYRLAHRVGGCLMASGVPEKKKLASCQTRPGQVQGWRIDTAAPHARIPRPSAAFGDDRLDTGTS